MNMLIHENTKQKGNATPCTKVTEFRTELSSRTDWCPKRYPTIVNILCISKNSGTVPTYGTACVPTFYTCTAALCTSICILPSKTLRLIVDPSCKAAID